jgi:hypothetical protein
MRNGITFFGGHNGHIGLAQLNYQSRSRFY